VRAVVQRVARASVAVAGETIAGIGRGLVVLVGVGHSDGEQQAWQLADKIVNLRIFADAEGKFNLSARDVAAQVLVVSQFTLYGEPLIARFAEAVAAAGLDVQTGRFGAHMLVEIWNDGPVTLIIDVD
jgi:D-tyrosyl-tRNA(Tyr) deacylase